MFDSDKLPFDFSEFKLKTLQLKGFKIISFFKIENKRWIMFYFN